MRIACPACAAAYDVPDERLAPGRVVRCAQCGVDWAPVAMPTPAAAPARPAMAQALVAPTGERPLTPRPSGRGAIAIAAAWLFSLLLLGVAGWGAYAWRADVVRAWPPGERAYQALGLSGLP